MDKKEQIRRGVIEMILLGITKNVDLVIIDNLESKLINKLYHHRKSQIVKDNFNIYLSGKHPDSEDINNTLDLMIQDKIIGPKLMGTQEIIIKKYYSRKEEDLKNLRKKMTSKEYDFLIRIGEKIEVKERYRKI